MAKELAKREAIGTRQMIEAQPSALQDDDILKQRAVIQPRHSSALQHRAVFCCSAEQIRLPNLLLCGHILYSLRLAVLCGIESGYCCVEV